MRTIREFPSGCRPKEAECVLFLGEAPFRDLVVAGGIKFFGLVIEHEVVDVHRRFLLVDEFAGFRVVEAQESAVITATGQQPIPRRREVQPLNEPFEFTVFNLV